MVVRECASGGVARRRGTGSWWRRFGWSLLLLLLVTGGPRVASATPDDRPGRAQVLLVADDGGHAVVGFVRELPGEWSDVAVVELPSGDVVDTLARNVSIPIDPIAWARTQLARRIDAQPALPARVSPDRTQVVTLRQRLHGERAPHVRASVELVDAAGRRTVLRRRIAEGCTDANLPARPFDIEALWVGPRTLVLAGSVISECGIVNLSDPFFEIITVRPGPKPLRPEVITALLRREVAHLDDHGSAYVADPIAMLDEAVAHAPVDPELRIDRAAAMLEHGRLDAEGVVDHLGDVLAIGTVEAYRAFDRARTLPAFVRLAEEPSVERFLEPVVHARGTRRGHAWRAECRHELGCAIRSKDELLLYVPRRGSWACTQRARALACIYTHTTNLDFQEGWIVDLDRRRVERIPLPPALGAIRGAPRWVEGELELDFGTPGHPLLTRVPLPRSAR